MKKLTFIDLFAGIGGFRIAFEKAGFQCVFSSEIDKNAAYNYEINFGEKPAGDITKIPSSDIPDHDVLCGGFPCQPFSIAGKQAGFADKRSNVFFDIVRILKDKQPSAFLLENVKNLIHINYGYTFEKIFYELKDAGYIIYADILNTKTHGNIPQNRPRVFIAGFKEKVFFEFPGKISLTKKPYEFLYRPKAVLPAWFYQFSDKIKNRLESEIIEKWEIYQWRRSYVRKNKHDVCPTLTANMGKGGYNVPVIRDDVGIRRLTPRECANFQGFPDYFNFYNVKNPGKINTPPYYPQYFLIGNSVSVPVVYRIAQSMKLSLNLTKPDFKNRFIKEMKKPGAIPALKELTA